MTKQSFRGFLALSAVIATVAALSVSPEARSHRDDPCDNPGNGQYALCAGIALGDGGYLIAPTGDYRYYFQGGQTYILDTSQDYDDWTVVRNIDTPGYDSPSHIEFDFPDFEEEFGTLNLTSFQYCEEGECPYRNSTTGNADGEAYLAMDSDGCARIYDQDGGEVRYEWCPEERKAQTRLATSLGFDAASLLKTSKPRLTFAALLATQKSTSTASNGEGRR